jgi:N-acetylglucosamine kinase-like BadF-type ATPase
VLYYGGVDGGGSKTVVLLVDERGHEIGRRRIGSANYRVLVAQGLPPLDAAQTVARQISQTCSELLPGGDRLDSVIVGLAGIDSPYDATLMTRALASTGANANWRVVNDVELLLQGLPGTDGVGLAVVAGTGSIALGRDAYANTARAGGWGFIIGDEGSGYAVGRGALQAITQAADGRGKPTALLDRILTDWNLHNPDELIEAVYGVESERNRKIAQLAELVLSVAADGDIIAITLMQEAACELARAVAAVYRRLDFGGTLPVLGVGGSLLVKNSLLRNETLAQLETFGVKLAQVVAIPDPAHAAACSLAISRQLAAHSWTTS